MWHFSKGYVIIQIEGISAAKLLRRMTESGIRVRNVSRTNPNTLTATIPSSRFMSLHALSHGLKVRVYISERGGYPFTLKKLYRRPMLWIGTLTLLIGIALLSGRIWAIRIEGAKRIDPNAITEKLSEYGIRPGAYLSGPILITAAEDLTAQIPDAAEIGLHREGVLLKVSVVEALPETPKKTDHVPSDVVAEKDGVVISLNVMRGQARVKVGDTVHKGDVLISGTVFYKDESYETSADGTVEAAVEYRSEYTVSDRVSEVKETDRTEEVRVLRFAGIEIAREMPAFDHYRFTGKRTVTVSELLPVCIDMITAHEIGFFERTLSDEEAEQLALSKAREAAYALVPRESAIINTYGTIRTVNGEKKAFVIVTAQETIGRTEENPHDG